MCGFNDKDIELLNELSNINGINTLILYNNNVYIPLQAKNKLSCIDCCFYNQCSNKSGTINYSLPCKNNKLNIPVIFKKTQLYTDFLDKDINTFILHTI